MVRVKPKITAKIPGASISLEWQIERVERKAAWELYIELITRVSANPVKPFEGDPVRALESLYAIFNITRSILKQYGASLIKKKGKNKVSLAFLSLSMLNKVLRPFLSKWHPALEAMKKAKGYSSDNPNMQLAFHDNHMTFYRELEGLQKELEAYILTLAKACGAEVLHGSLTDGL